MTGPEPKEDLTTPEREVLSLAIVAHVLGRRGGLAAAGAGARKMQAALTPEERSERAKKAAAARWRKAKKKGRAD